MNDKLRRFLYVDSIGISSLYSQLSEFYEKERRVATHEKKATSGKGRFSTKFFVGIFGGSGEVESTHTRGLESQTEQILTKEAEQKLIEVESSLSKLGDLIEVNSVRILAQIASDKLPIFIKGILPVTIQTFQHSSNIIDEVIKSQTVALELDESSLAEGWALWPHILMGGSLSKFVGSRDIGNGTYTIGYTSHLAVLLRSILHCSANIGIFGHIQQTAKNLYIKSYALWL